jgi:predicted  nucleic acid-binding Zn-ribbon protein
MLQQAALAGHDNVERATDRAQKLAAQLKAAEDCVAQLEAEIRSLEDRAVRAEKWLLHVHKEIEQTFLNQNTAENGARIVVQR